MIKSVFNMILSFIIITTSMIFGGPKVITLTDDLKRDGTPKKYFTISFDDGITQDLKIIEICKKYGFYDCTFNINTGLCGENWDWVGKAIGDPTITHIRFTEDELKSGIYDGFDVAVHTLDHTVDSCDKNPFKVRKEINVDATNIYRYTGFYPLGMAWPGGDGCYNDKTIEMVSKNTRMGFARGTTSTHSFDLPQYFLKWLPTCSIADRNVLELAQEFIDAKCDEDMLFYVWGHGYELDLLHNYDTFEKLIKMMVDDENIVTVSNSEFYLLFKDEIPRWKNSK